MAEEPIRRIPMPDGRTMYSALAPGGNHQQGVDTLLLSDDPTMRAHGRLLATGVAATVDSWLKAEKVQAFTMARDADDLAARLNDVLNAVTNLASGCIIQCAVGLTDPSQLEQLVADVAEEMGTHLRGKLLVWRQWQTEKAARGGSSAEGQK